MDMQFNDDATKVMSMIENLCFGFALPFVENLLLANPNPTDMEKLRALKNDYDLLLNYWHQGYDDPERPKVYGELMQRLYTLYANMELNRRLRQTPFLKAIHSRPRKSGRSWGLQTIRRELENFVSDQALLELEPEHARAEKSRQLYSQHAAMMADLFDYIVTAHLWSPRLAAEFEAMLLSPTVDVIDQQLIVSAIMLSNIMAFGFNKFSVLVNVYRKADNEQLRQRALVGWVLSLDAGKSQLYPELVTMVHDMCADEATRQELTELQMQLVYCIEAEADGRKITDEIMPELIKGSNIRLSSHGTIEEAEEDSLEEILHPEAVEQNMERMEQSIGRMVDMQKQGADIYFGGFKQMKRFPFFNQLSNWFVPFYPKHPAVSAIWEKTHSKRFLQLATSMGAFCDSDKYSFVLAFEHVVTRFPKPMLDLVEQGEAAPVPVGGEVTPAEQQQPAFVRRVYLQNLYRFYKVFAERSAFDDPFASPSRYLFFASGLFRQSQLEERFVEVAAFLMKKKRKDDCFSVLQNCSLQSYSYQYYMLMGSVASADKSSNFAKALALKPDSEKALSGYARACFAEKAYAEAVASYEKLLLKHPDSKAYQLNMAACMANCGREGEAETLLFKLAYLYPADLNVERVLAWVLLLNGKRAQAANHYQHLVEQEEPKREDLANYAICLWLDGQPGRAATAFRKTGADYARRAIIDEQDTLVERGINKTDLLLMLGSL